MASRKDHNYYSAIARIEANMDPKEIAEELELSVNTVRRWKTEYMEHKRLNTLTELMDMRDYTSAISELTSLLPATKDMVGEKANELSKSINSLVLLQEEFHETARYLNTRLKSLAMSASNTGELVDLVNSLSTLQNAFFNKNTTQVNVQNNYGQTGSQPYSNFLSDKPNL